MKYIFLILVLIAENVYSQGKCDKYSGDYIPKNLNDALSYLDCTWSENEKNEFRKQDEETATASQHSGAGLGMRNGWGLWKGKNSLVKYFHSIGIFHPDDMSGIILASFHRQLNGQDINLKDQVKHYQGYWASIRARYLAHNKLYKYIKIGDTVNVVFGKQRVSGKVSSLTWLYYGASIGDTANCFVQAVVLQKRKKKDSRTLTIQVVKTSNCNYCLLGSDSLHVGNKFHYPMTYFNLSLIKN